MLRAYVLRQNTNLVKSLVTGEIKEFMVERLAKYKRLDVGVVFVNKIPKNPSGQILKRTLREWAAQEIKQERQASKL